VPTTGASADGSLRYSGAQIRVDGGKPGGTAATSISNSAFIPSITPNSNAPDFAITLFGKGAEGGDPGAFDPNTAAAGGEIVGIPGSNGSLLIAKFQAGRTFSVSFGLGGDGAPARTATSSQRSVGGGKGKTGYALFVRLS